uniref:AH domain-containing protein n=1 Tax=Steinernema glaseri TaxID=37863 RepID=A0A1I7XZ59_9BILA
MTLPNMDQMYTNMTSFYESSTSGLNFDRFTDEIMNESTVARLRQQYWTAKQLIRSKLGRKEDEHLLASDAEFDAKLSLFYSVRDTTQNMLACIEDYHHYLTEASRVEGDFGMFLKASGKSENTDAGKVMSAVGRAQTFSAAHRSKIRKPLIRFYQELDVFNERAISDCAATVEAAEKARIEYRGSLLWMKKTSEELDPDTEKQMEKFRMVQSAVRKNKERFDNLKLDTLQKVDLLAASRCNLFSNLILSYQDDMLNFLNQAKRAYTTVGENIKGYDNYEFQVLKDLIDPLKSLEMEDFSTKKIAAESTIEEGRDCLLDINGEEAAHQQRKTSRDSLERLLFGLDSPDRKPLPARAPTENAEPGERSLIEEADEVLRVESPLGIVEFDEANEQPTPQKKIGPLPMLSEVENNVEIPKLAPPEGWENKPKQSDNHSLLSLDTAPVSSSSSLTTWNPFTGNNAQSSSNATPASKSDFLPSDLLDATPNNSFPNPFSGPEKNWTDLLAELEQFNTRTDTSGC